jgi:hypothetical protein
VLDYHGRRFGYGAKVANCILMILQVNEMAALSLSKNVATQRNLAYNHPKL